MKITSVFTALLFMVFSFVSKAQITDTKKNKKTEWLVAALLQNKTDQTTVLGNPTIFNSPYGNAVAFNGIDDALFLKEMPLKGIESFTVEMIFKPESNGVFEQRILQIGEITGDRMLLEIRVVDSNWYFDGFVASRGVKLALAKEELIHPLGKWYHVAFVVTPNSLTTFVNGTQELQQNYTFNPIEQGQASIGVRMNKVTWFKGVIYKIQISPQALKPNQFLTL
ncbi:LamG domain-containing protein [Flavobacterium undicola]|uniref:LamG domain-containing protein n=1 Tax=Flavobacterium undicola TaxID=1932779 RepID=UPI0013768DEB|nr:LamG domain-containing protein [Flavobacterium undicola]MBA0882326.1 LamG domain-containing protein [Flavobacterium undicola]